MNDKPKIIITANSLWYIENFRENTIKELSLKYDIKILVPFESKKKNKNIIFFKFNNKNTNFFWELFYLISFSHKVLLIKPRYILSFTPKVNLYSIIISYFIKSKCVINISGFGETKNLKGIKNIIYTKLTKIFLKRVHHILFQNTDIQETYRRNNLLSLPSYQLINGSGVNIKKIRNYSSKNKNKKFSFIMACRLIKEKGVIEYLEAAKFIKYKYKNRCDFFLFGLEDSSYRSIPLELIKKYQRLNVINLYVNKKNILKYISQADCSVLPTYYNEGLPKFLLESLASSNIILTTKTPGCKMTLIENVNGFFVKKKSSYDLIKKFEKILSLERNQILRLKNNSYKFANKFNENTNINIYKSLLN